MSSLQIHDYLQLSNDVFKNELNESSPISKQPPHIKIPLKLHQLTVLHSMKNNEIHYPSGFTLPSGETCYSMYGILGDRVGVGKTLMILGHISQMAYEPITTEYSINRLDKKSSPAFFSILPRETNNTVFETLLVVPHTIYKQWQEAIQTQTTLSCNYLRGTKDLDKKDLLQSLQESHITLISNTLLASFMATLRAKNIQNPFWRRVIYDEADSIKIQANAIRPCGRITWFVTASYNNLLFVNQYFHTYHLNTVSDTFVNTLLPNTLDMINSIQTNGQTILFYKMISYPFFKDFFDLKHPMRIHTIIKNSDSFLDVSVSLPPCNRTSIECYAPIQQQIVQAILPQATQDMLHAGDIQGAIQSLGISSRTVMTLPQAVCFHKQKELARLERKLKYKSEEEYDTVAVRDSVLSNIQIKIDTCKREISSIETRMGSISKDSCSICFESPTNACVSPCCGKPFCGGCILTWMNSNSSCPMCRSEFSVSSLISINSVDTPSHNIRSKKEEVLHILEENPNGQFLIFSRYDNSFQALKKDIEDLLSYNTATICGNKHVIGKILDDFKSKELRVLFLNSKTMGAGMNIQTATHVILLHKMTDEEERQIMGRAYRMGRTEPLEVFQLLHKSE